MTRKIPALIVPVLLLTIAFPLARGDVLLIEEVRKTNTMELPVNGQSKAEVQSKFGAPGRKYDAVGTPPITRWDYDGYSVFFEYDLVLSSVLKPGALIEK